MRRLAELALVCLVAAVIATARPVAAGIGSGSPAGTSTVSFGGIFTVLEVGDAALVNGEGASLPVTLGSSTCESISPVTGFVRVLTWSTASASTDTVMRVHRGSNTTDVTLTGAAGAIELDPPAAVTQGEALQMELESGTAPGSGTYSLIVSR